MRKRPSRIQRSTSRREPTPAADRSFCTRVGSATLRPRLAASRSRPLRLAPRLPAGSARGRRGGINPRRRRPGRPRGLAAAAHRTGRRRARPRRIAPLHHSHRLRRAPRSIRYRRGRLARFDRGLGARERQLHAQVLELLELRERRQIVEFLQAEVVEEVARGAEQLGTPRDVAMSDDTYPAALEQRLDDVRVHRNAANLLDLSARDRLAVRHQRERLEQGARVFGGPLLPQARHGLGDGRADLNAIAARDLDQLDAAGLVV